MIRLSAIADRILGMTAFLATVLLVLGAARLITTQYQIRQVFIEIEAEKRIDSELQDDASQLSIELARAALPASVNAKALKKGFSTAELERTVMIEVPKERLEHEQMEFFRK